ncbi:MAG: SDR family NAD(P)-dependent oxidoreductase [Pseudomonadota bacterium]
MAEFADKVVWITGASSGIGEALARVFSKHGAHIILSGRRVDALNAVAADLKTDTLVLPFESTDYNALPARVSDAWSWKGRVDVLVNNAGVSQRSLAIETAPEVYRDLIDIDLIAPIWLTQLQLPHMVEAGGGRIVAISSVAGRIGAPLRTAYCAAKHGLIGYMDALRAEVDALHNIKVTNVLPGSVATNVSRNALTADGSTRGRSDAVIDAGDDPTDCARAIVDAVAADAPELVFAKGQELEATTLRHADPDAFFQLIGAMGRQAVERHRAETDEP